MGWRRGTESRSHGRTTEERDGWRRDGESRGEGGGESEKIVEKRKRRRRYKEK